MTSKHALLIGMDFFQDPKLSKLLAPKDDVYELKEVLLDKNIGKFDTVEILFNSDLVPTQSALHELFDNRNKDDLLLLYYTGHGLVDTDGSLFLSLSQTKAKVPSIGSIEAGFVRRRMNASNAESQIIVLDCCHSGAFMNGASKSADAHQRAITGSTFEAQGKGRYVLTACADTEFAFEAGHLREGDPEARPRSIFTKCFVDGLKSGDAAPESERITIDALYHYTRTRVIEGDMPMDPQRWISGGSGELIIAQNPELRVPVPDDLRLELVEGSKYARLGAVEKLRNIVSTEPNTFKCKQAKDILNTGLSNAEWVEVHDKILEALELPSYNLLATEAGKLGKQIELHKADIESLKGELAQAKDEIAKLLESAPAVAKHSDAELFRAKGQERGSSKIESANSNNSDISAKVQTAPGRSNAQSVASEKQIKPPLANDKLYNTLLVFTFIFAIFVAALFRS